MSIQVLNVSNTFLLQRGSSTDADMQQGLPKIPSGSLGSFKHGMGSVLKKVQKAKFIVIQVFYDAHLSDSAIARSSYSKNFTPADQFREKRKRVVIHFSYPRR